MMFSSRPGDRYHPDFFMGQPGHLDISVWKPMQSALITEAVTHSECERTGFMNCQFVIVVGCSIHWSLSGLGVGRRRVWNI